jgi:hypothetical protein
MIWRNGNGESLWVLLVSLLIMTVLGGCPLPVGQEYAIFSRGQPEKTVLDYDLQHYVPIPVAGAAAVMGLTRSDLAITVQWKDASGADIDDAPSPFTEDTVYQAEITLTAQDGYTFDENIPFAYLTASAEGLVGGNIDTKSRILTVTYNPTGQGSEDGSGRTALDYDLQHYVPIPAARTAAVTDLIRPDLAITVQWKDAGGTDIDAPSPFALNTVYKAEITLTAQDGYTFDENIPFAYLTATVAELVGNNDNTEIRILTVTYNSTGQGSEQKVLNYDLQHYVPVPVAGAVPVTSLTQPDLTVEVKWKDATGEAITPALTSFVRGTVYQAEITLRAQSPYTFDADIRFEYRSAVVEDLSGENTHTQSRTLAVKYKPAGQGSEQKVLDYDLQHYVPVPAVGARPITSLTRPDLMVEVTWKDATGKAIIPIPNSFVKGTVYQAKITLTARSPYTFDAGTPFEYLTAAAELSGKNDDTQSRTLIATYYPPGEEAEDGKVVDYDLQHYVPIPATGAAVVKELIRPDLTVEVKWMDENGIELPGLDPFVQDTVYQAKITLTARSLYTFAANIPFKYISAKAEEPTGDNANTKRRTLTVRYLPADSRIEISNINLTPYIPAPVTGELPKTELSAGTYAGAVEWFIGVQPAPEGRFKPNTVYTAKVTLTPKEEDYKFSDTPSVIHNAGVVGTFSRKNDESLTGRITFHATDVTLLTLFSGIADEDGEDDSIIDLIRAAGGQKSLYLQLTPETEEVELIDERDLGEKGLVLEYDSSNSKTKSPANLVIDGGDMTLVLVGLPTGKPLITVGNGVTLTLRNITLKGLNGLNGQNSNNAPMILVERGGKLIMEDGVQIMENKNSTNNDTNTGTNTSGVSVAEDGTFTMNGGEIHHNTGTGVSVGGTFTMNDGEIHDNTGTGVNVDGTFFMYNGVIQSNMSTGVSVGGTFTMYNGVIRNNESGSAGGVSVEGLFIMHDGIIAGNNGSSGGGVWLNKAGYMIMHHGTIRNNTAKEKGGGVSVVHPQSVFTMNSGIISGNTAGVNNNADVNGGGVYLSGGGSFTLNGGTISDNTAVKNGGGVAVDEGSFSMNFGFIQGNKVNDKDGNGGGVYVNKGTFSMTDGSISGNSIYSGGPDPAGGGKGCGVYEGGSGKFRKTRGTISGVVTTGMNEGREYGKWEDALSQNYYQKRVHPEGDNEDDSENISIPYRDKDNYPESVTGRGFAVYYDYYEGEESKPRHHNMTAGPEHGLDSDSDENWSGDVYPESDGG